MTRSWVRVRRVFPKSPADIAGIKPGTHHETGVWPGLAAILGRDQLTSVPIACHWQRHSPRARNRKQETEKVDVTLGTMSTDIPDILTEPASLNKALTPQSGAA